jgi:probable DNA repair protein
MSALVEALAAGATVVTPNNRLAREAAARYDDAQRAGGARAWASAAVLPWTQWLEELWRTALADRALPEPPVLVARSATGALWHSIVARHDADLLNARGAARHAADAWMTFHAWRDADEAFDAVAAQQANDDQAVFARWAARYRARLASLRAIDSTQLADTLRGAARPSWVREIGRVVLHGFLALTPQQRRLVDALRAAGLAIDELRARTGTPEHRGRIGFATPRDEIVHALGFARAHLRADPASRVAIVVADLDERRDEVLALAEEMLCPEHLLVPDSRAARPYGISLGEPLATVPIVACALDLVRLAVGRIDANVASSLVRAPFLPEARARWQVRASIERDWRRRGQREVGWFDVVHALQSVDAALHQRFATLAPPSRAARLPREWARAWSGWLAALGWPGDATLTSVQWQARDAWSTALAQFAATGTITGPCSAAAALEALHALLADTLFQPETPPARIQILGVLEAAGMAFDCAWLAGFDADRWPGARAANPFLALAWQYARGVPRANPDAGLAHARRVTAALVASAREIVVSHAQTIDDAPARISPLFADWQPLGAMQIACDGRYADSMSAPLERFDDTVAPAVPEGARFRGGASLLESQSACPFQAFARHRLDARAWDQCPLGLSAAERGNILHDMLKAFWDVVGDHAALLALDEPALGARIDAAVEAGKAKLGAARWRALPPAVQRAEATRLAATLHACIEHGERERPAFRVRAPETRVDWEFGGIAHNVRIDRIDELAAGGLAIIDYKSGRVVQPARWFADRPEGIQLGVYAQALERADDEPIRALAFAQVRAGDVDVAGIVEASDLWPALRTPERLARAGLDDWPHARAVLRDRVLHLAGDVSRGSASVAPRDRTTCRYCGLQSLCRIQRLDDRGGADDRGVDAGAADE